MSKKKKKANKALKLEKKNEILLEEKKVEAQTESSVHTARLGIASVLSVLFYAFCLTGLFLAIFLIADWIHPIMPYQGSILTNFVNYLWNSLAYQ